MPLITRGRLSVQRVSAKCWDVIQTMADQGGWDNMSFEKKPAKARHPVDETRPTTKHSAEHRDVDGAAMGDDATKQLIEQELPRTDAKERKRKASTSITPEDKRRPRHKILRSKR